MFVKWIERLSEPKSRHYTGRHRAVRSRRRTYHLAPPAERVS
jgi:hypothetical protein